METNQVAKVCGHDIELSNIWSGGKLRGSGEGKHHCEETLSLKHRKLAWICIGILHVGICIHWNVYSSKIFAVARATYQIEKT